MAAVYGYPFFNVILTLRIEAFYKCFRQSYIVGIRLSPKFQCTRERKFLIDRAFMPCQMPLKLMKYLRKFL